MTDLFLQALLEILRQRGETVTCAESCTGGLLAGRITDIPGSSDVFKQSYVTYCDEAKESLLHVRKETLEQWTAVSHKTALEMARGAADNAGADAALAVTGYAGPPADAEDLSVGTVYIACTYHGTTSVDECHFTGSRREIRDTSVEHALGMLAQALTTASITHYHAQNN